MADRELDFEAAMRALGVRPMTEPGSPTRSARPPRSTPTAAKSARPGRSGRGPQSRDAPQAARGSRRAEPTVVPRSSVGPKSGEPAPARPQSAPGAVPAPPPASSLVERRLQARVTELEAALATAQAATAAADGRESEARGAHAAVQRRLARLERAHAGREASEPGPVRAHFEARGALGASESIQLMRQLLETGRGEDLLELLAPRSTTEFSDWLDENTAILGDCGACPVAGSRAILRVPQRRCEVCAGSDVRRAGRRFVDACLSDGITRVTIVGGSPKYHRQLHELVEHHRLKLRTVPGRSRRTRKQARHDLRGSDLVVIWGPTHLSHCTSDLYTDQADQGRLMVVPHRGIASMLEDLSARVLGTAS